MADEKGEVEMDKINIAGGAGMIIPSSRFKHIVRRSIVGYFAPAVAACRLFRKPGWNYIHELRVVYRYSFGKK